MDNYCPYYFYKHKGKEEYSMDEELTYKIVDFVEDRAVTTCSDGREVEILFEEIPEESKVGDSLIFLDGLYVMI